MAAMYQVPVIINIEALCAVPPEALAHSPGQKLDEAEVLHDQALQDGLKS